MIKFYRDWVEGGTSTVTYIRPAALGTFFPGGVSFSVKVFSARWKYSQTVRLNWASFPVTTVALFVLFRIHLERVSLLYIITEKG